MLADSIILITLALFALNGFQRGFLTLAGRLLVLLVSLGVAFLMLGPTALALDSLPFIDDLAESINDQIIYPLMPASASLADAIANLQLPAPVEHFLLAEFPQTEGPFIDVWPQLSATIAQYLVKAVTFIILLILVSVVIQTLVSLMTTALDHVPVLGGLNRLAGLLVGALHGALILALAIFFTSLFTPYFPSLGLLLDDSWLIRQFYAIDWVGLFLARFLEQI
ncbi:MAG: CvpA family protein [Eubacteriales bacterium]|nr:CvpA family protein [Eubacteriales bacterium]